jgi:UDP-N-acetylglucosamine diphosphorylase/glucosamine-1-phosphate N-acetyltransferase
MANLPPLILFDDGLGLLSPLTDLRPSFDVRTGAFTQRERIARLSGARIAACSVPPALEPLFRSALPRVAELRPDVPHLFINGRCPLPSRDALSLASGHALIEERSGHVIAAHAPPKLAAQIARSDATGFTVVKHAQHTLISRPWDVRAFRDACIAHDLGLLFEVSAPNSTKPHGGFVFRISPAAKAHPSTIFDAEHGNIFVDDHAVIRPGAIIVGPAYVGPHSTVLERTLIKANTAIGPHCKVAGEIMGTIFQGYANKAHDGHLGDSWVGEWANLGAGTTNSNLLNTYGDVIARALTADGKAGSNERTGQQFLGATIGDHVKTAICTRIMTGAIVGTGTMFAASSPLSGTIPPLSWITDSGTKPFAVDKFVEIAKTVMSRRKIVPSEQYLHLLRTLQK